jgi:AcrR family transcriptional regulator
MNHVPPHHFSTDVKPLTRRGMAKLRTRHALLAAGKQLFTEHGYADATVRDIARAAGLSTGAVFANFNDKADLFAEILANDNEALANTMRPLAQTQGRPAQEALVVVLAAGYAFHLPQLPLLQAAQSVSWTHTPAEEARLRWGVKQILGIVEGVLRRGVTAGDLAADTDIALTADLVWQAYLSNFRRAVFDGEGLEDLTARLERQLQVVLKAA